MEIRHGGAPGGWLPPIVPRELRAAGSEISTESRSLAGNASSGHPFAGCPLDTPTRKSAPCGILRTHEATNEAWDCDGSVSHDVIEGLDSPARYGCAVPIRLLFDMSWAHWGQRTVGSNSLQPVMVILPAWFLAPSQGSRT
jgi:hypothetical protein